MKDMKFKNLLIYFIFTAALFLYAGRVNANDYIAVQASPTGILAGGTSTSLITATIYDASDQVDITAVNEVYFSLGTSGPVGGGPHVYNFNDGLMHRAYASNNLPSIPPTYMNKEMPPELPAVEVDKLKMDDTMMLDIYKMPGYYSAFQASFVIHENISNIVSMQAKFAGKCPEGNCRLIIYAFNNSTGAWDEITTDNMFLGYNEQSFTKEAVNLVNFADYIWPDGGDDRMEFLYVMENPGYGLKVNYVELSVSESGGMGGEFGNVYDFMDPSHEAFSSMPLAVVPPPGGPAEINDMVPPGDIMEVDGYQWDTGRTANYSAFRARYNSIMEDPAEITKIRIFIRAATDGGGDLMTRVYAWNGIDYNSIGSAVYFNSNFNDYEVEINSNISSFIIGGAIDVLFGAMVSDSSIKIDYTGIEVFTESGMVFDFKYGNNEAFHSPGININPPLPDPFQVDVQLANPDGTMLIEQINDSMNFEVNAAGGNFAFFMTNFDLDYEQIELNNVNSVKISINAWAGISSAPFTVSVWKDSFGNWESVNGGMFDMTPNTFNFEFFPGTDTIGGYLAPGGILKVLFSLDNPDVNMIIDYVKVELIMGEQAPAIESECAELIVTNPVTTVGGIATIELLSKNTTGYAVVVAITDGLTTSNSAETGVSVYSGGADGYGKINGDIYYNSAQYSGNIYVGAFLNLDANGNPMTEPESSTMINAPGVYTLDNVYLGPTGTGENYYVVAYMDTNSNYILDDGEPAGRFFQNDDNFSPVYVQGEMHGIDVTLEDPTGNRSISGTIYYYDPVESGPYDVKLGAFSDPSFAEAYIEGGADCTLIISSGSWYSGSYMVSGLVDGIYYLGAFIDKNGNDERDPWEPYGVYKCGTGGNGMEGACEVNLFGYNMDYVNFDVFDPAVTEPSALRGRVMGSGTTDPMGGVTVELWDSNNSWEPDDHTFSTSTVSVDFWMGPAYNFEIHGIYPQSESYAYFVKVKKDGYVVNMQNYNIYFTTNVQYTTDFFISQTSGTLTLGSDVTVDNGVTSSSTTVTITPDGDSAEDFANIYFSVNDIPMTADFSGAIARVIIDTNKDSAFEVFNWDDVTWDSNGNPWYGNPPQMITYEEIEVIRAQKDWYMDWWLGNETAGSKDINVMWEGRDNSWNVLPPGDYAVKIQVCHSSYWDNAYLGESNTGLTVTIDSNIPGLYGWVYYLVGGSTAPVEGARVEAGTYDSFGEAYTDSEGSYFISSIPKDRNYYIHVEKDGYDPHDVPGVLYDAGDTTKQVPNIILNKGGNLSGTITLPAPFTAYYDQWGNYINELWGQVNAWDESGNYGFTNFRIVSGQSSKTYEILLPPGFYRVEVNVFGYSLQVEEDVEVTSYGAAKDFDIGGTDRNVTVSGMVKITSIAVNNVYVSINLKNDADMKYAYSGTEIYASTDTAAFMIYDVPSNTTYELSLYADGYAEKNVFDIVIGTTDVTLGTYAFSEGGIVQGEIQIDGDLTGLSYNNLWINAWSPSSGHCSGTDITLPSSATGTVQGFTIKGLVDDTQYYLDTWLEGFEMTTRPYMVTAPTDTAVIELQDFGGSVSGIVAGTGCVPSEVRVTVTGGMTGEMRVESLTTIYSTSGTFKIENLGTGEYMLSVNQYDVAPSTLNYMGKPDGDYATLTKLVGVTNGADFNLGVLSLYTSGSISGKVYISTATGEYDASNLDGKQVEVTPRQMDWMGMTDAYHQATLYYGDVDYATFTVKGIDKGVYIVRPPVYLNGGSSSPDVAGTPKTITVDSGEEAQVDLYLTDGYMIAGSVERPITGSEYFNIELCAAGYDRETISSYQVDFSTRPTSRTAQYTLGPVNPGTYYIRIWSQNYKEVAKEVTVTGSDISVAAIMMGKGANIKGRLVDAKTGQAVSGKNGIVVSCEARPWVEGSHRQTEQWDSERKIDETTGEFELKNLPEGNYVLRVSAQQDDMYGTAAQYKDYAGLLIGGITVPDNAEDIDLSTIQLKEGSTISGRVVDSESQGIANIRMAAEPSSHHGESIQLKAMTDTGGYYTIKGVDEAVSYWDVFAAVRPEWSEGIVSGYGEKYKHNVKINENEGAEGINFTLSEANSNLKGKIKAVDSRALVLPFEEMGSNMPGAMVLLQEKGKIYNDPMEGLQHVTEYDGEFTIEGIVEGEYVLKVFSKGLRMHISDISVHGALTDMGDITLLSGKKVEGAIVDKLGRKVKSSEVHEVVAVTKDFSRFLFGTINSNSVTNEIESYSVEGLADNIDYYIALVGEGKADVFIDPDPVNFIVSVDTITKGITYTDNPPQFIVQVGRKAEDKFEINVWSNETLSERDVSDVISVIEGNFGGLTEMIMSDNRMECSALYSTVSANEEKFKIRVTGHDIEGQETTEEFTIYTGEKGRNEEFINPVVGGNVIIGDGDSSGFYLPMGTRLIAEGKEVDDLTSLKIFVASIDSTEVGALGIMKKGMGAYSFIIPSLAVEEGAPGEMFSSIYNMEIYLITGPLAQLAQGETANVTIRYDLSASTTPVGKLDINYYDDDSGRWVKEKSDRTVDTENNTITVNVSHFSKYAAFSDETAPPVPEPGANYEPEINGVVLDWDSSTASDIAYYKIYQSSVQAENDDEGGYYTFLASVTAPTHKYIVSIVTGPYFAVSAVDNATAPNESGLSVQVSVYYDKDDHTMWVYPNPFHPTVNTPLTIKYKIPSTVVDSVDVDIKIFNLAGELVKDTLGESDTKKDGGYEYRATWDATNEDNVKVADGIYLCYIKMGKQEIIKKVALLRSN